MRLLSREEVVCSLEMDGIARDPAPRLGCHTDASITLPSLGNMKYLRDAGRYCAIIVLHGRLQGCVESES